ncbi:MAG: UDP-N-acetylenolpyruvoylglucosamine reductase [Sulfuricurvum sp. PC08-66]|nr:MAG: UDP-N-acetylenolpyruvoylglucosamine reductase [Sulfuricurvum sp. PC08-66]
MTQTIDLSHFTSIKIGPVVEVTLIDEERIIPEGHTIMGHGNNLLISPTPPPLMMLSKAFNYIRIEENRLIIGAATPSGKVVSFARKHNIAHFEFLAKLPGVIGGVIKMNGGLKEYEVFNHLLGIITPSGYHPKAQIQHSYRHTAIDEVIFEGHFEIHEGFDALKIEEFLRMRDNQPQLPSAGSCFKNPIGDYAGRLIEAVGYKGKRLGNMGFSDKHANFLVNYGGGTYEEAIQLIDEVRTKVLKDFGITLELEIVVL